MVWLTEDWSRCSVSCGGGTRQRNDKCTEEAMTQRVKWLTEDWSRCSVSCGGGTRQRNVICTEEANGTRSRISDFYPKAELFCYQLADGRLEQMFRELWRRHKTAECYMH
ncbi:hypothetical protein J6590_044818 [Homalodisca vitripennis]|nr:hypothetical protein J6590_044818 [Homalodisca vitripennis]